MDKSKNIKLNNSIIWNDLVCCYLDCCNIDYSVSIADGYFILKLLKYNFAIHLISIKNSFSPEELIVLQNSYQNKNIQLVHLWEDVWLTKQVQVKARIKSLIGENLRIHGRKTQVMKITKPIADAFLTQYHLQGTVSSRYKLGLFLKDDLVAVATFSALRKMDYTEPYTSAELIRFAVKEGYTVVGGLSKLIKYFIELKSPNDIMSYADMDWSLGDSYLKLGFKYVGKIDARYYEIKEDLHRKLLTEKEKSHSNMVFNTGSLKYVLDGNG